jgi:predicted Zn finger-like uncharacterized protein
MLTVSCPKCSRRMKIRDESNGKRVKCGGCSTVFVASADRNLPATEPAARRWPARLIYAVVAFGCCAMLVAVVLVFRPTHVVPAVEPKPPAAGRATELKATNAELMHKRDRIAAEYAAAVAESRRLAPPPELDSDEKVRRFYESRARIEEAEVAVYQANDDRVRELARQVDADRIGKDEDEETKRRNDQAMRDAEIAWHKSKIARTGKRLAAANAGVEAEKTMYAARKRAASELSRLEGELQTIERQIEESK